MINKQKNAKAFVFLLPAFILFFISVPPVWTNLTGEEIIISANPVDPVDIFHGSYTELEYAIETVDTSLLTKDTLTKVHKKYPGEEFKVFALLEPDDDGLYEVKQVSSKKPKKGTFIKGILQIPWQEGEKQLHIDYSLEHFYTTKKEAEQLEAAAASGSGTAILKIKNGRAVLTDVSIRSE